MNGLPSFISMTVIIILLIMVISIFLFKSKSILFPVIILTLSVVSLISSFYIGSWEGMGLGVFSLSLLIASFVSLILLTFYEAFKITRKST